jgi:hypothetical protein
LSPRKEEIESKIVNAIYPVQKGLKVKKYFSLDENNAVKDNNGESAH